MLDLWAHLNGVTPDFSRPGKPTDNAFIESFNGRVREECLNRAYFTSLEDSRERVESWRIDDKEVRPRRPGEPGPQGVRRVEGRWTEGFVRPDNPRLGGPTSGGGPVRRDSHIGAGLVHNGQFSYLKPGLSAPIGQTSLSGSVASPKRSSLTSILPIIER
jgi:hypothetical protein